jgi:hypothetical protein
MFKDLAKTILDPFLMTNIKLCEVNSTLINNVFLKKISESQFSVHNLIVLTMVRLVLTISFASMLIHPIMLIIGPTKVSKGVCQEVLSVPFSQILISLSLSIILTIIMNTISHRLSSTTLIVNLMSIVWISVLIVSALVKSSMRITNYHNFLDYTYCEINADLNEMIMIKFELLKPLCLRVICQIRLFCENKNIDSDIQTKVIIQLIKMIGIITALRIVAIMGGFVYYIPYAWMIFPFFLIHKSLTNLRINNPSEHIYIVSFALKLHDDLDGTNDSYSLVEKRNSLIRISHQFYGVFMLFVMVVGINYSFGENGYLESYLLTWNSRPRLIEYYMSEWNYYKVIIFY